MSAAFASNDIRPLSSWNLMNLRLDRGTPEIPVADGHRAIAPAENFTAATEE
jgi:hypothetical protein